MFVGVQLPEKNETSEKIIQEKYPTIPDIARERIHRVIEKIKGYSSLDITQTSNLGFKSFHLSPSNFKQWRGDGIDTPEELAEQMNMFIKSEKDGADVDDMLYELLLKYGQELTTPIKTLNVDGARVFAVREQKMLFVLENISEPMIDTLLALKPDEIIALDSVFHDSDELKTNFDLQCRDASVKFTCI